MTRNRLRVESESCKGMKVKVAKWCWKTSQELRMLSSVTLNCQVTKIIMNSGSQLSEL